MVPKILIADDDPDVRESLAEILAVVFDDEPHRIEVLTATGGREAVATCKEAGPALVLMDISMPDLDGIEAFHQIADAPSPTPVVVFITGYSTEGVQNRIDAALAAGAVDCLTKPISLSTLEHLILHHVFGHPEP